jgi:hypothetical protein
LVHQLLGDVGRESEFAGRRLHRLGEEEHVGGAAPGHGSHGVEEGFGDLDDDAHRSENGRSGVHVESVGVGPGGDGRSPGPEQGGRVGHRPDDGDPRKARLVRGDRYPGGHRHDHLTAVDGHRPLAR